MAMTQEAALSHSEQNAKAWLETIREHLACLHADRKRLEELRDERDGWEKSAEPSHDCWEDEYANDAEELAELEAAVQIDGEEMDADTARERIEGSPLSVEVRDGWKSPGAESEGPEEFCILLSTGGPALRIMGELDDHCQPTRAYLQHQDWGTPWTDYYETGSGEVLLEWASVFYFGE